MGNYSSNFDFPIKNQLTTQSWDRVKRAWLRAEEYLQEQQDQGHNSPPSTTGSTTTKNKTASSSKPKDNPTKESSTNPNTYIPFTGPRIITPDTTITRREFFRIFTDTDGHETGTYYELPVTVYRTLDYKWLNKVPLIEIFLISAMFTQTGTGTVNNRWLWLLQHAFQSQESSLLPTQISNANEGMMTENEVLHLIRTLNSVLYKCGIITRTFNPDEDYDVLKNVFSSIRRDDHGGSIVLKKLSIWLQGEDAVRLFVTRFQSTLEIYEKRADSDALPPLISMMDPSALLMGTSGGNTSGMGQLDEAAIKEMVLAAVTSRQVLGELQFKTGLSPAELSTLKMEFSAKANVDGTLDKVAFRTIMLTQFPSLEADATLDRLFNAFDADGSGCIEFREFVIGASKMVRGGLKDKVDLLFSIFDSDGSGAVSVKELMRFIKNGENELEAVYLRAKQQLENLHNALGTEVVVPGSKVIAPQEKLITEDDFVHLILTDPVMVTWGASVAQSTAIQITTRVLEELANMLSNKEALSRSALEENTDTSRKTLPSQTELTEQLNRTFTFRKLIEFWNARSAYLHPHKSSSLTGGKNEDMFMQKLTTGGLTGHDKHGTNSKHHHPAAPPPPPKFTDDTVTLENIHRFLSATFDIELPRGLRGLNAGVRSLFDTLSTTITTVPTTNTQGSSSSSDATSATSQALPVVAVLSQLGLALSHTPEELAMIMYRQADLNGDGTLTIAEMGRWMLAQQRSASNGLSAGQRVLISLDVDGDGTVTETEFRSGIMRNPALLDALGSLLGAMDIQAQQSERSYGANSATNKGNTKGGNSTTSSNAPNTVTTMNGTTTDSKTATNAIEESLRMLPTSWNTELDANRVHTSFAGRNLFGIGKVLTEDEDEARRRPISEAEKINNRRRKIVNSGQKLRATIEQERARMSTVAAEVRSILEDTKRRVDVEVQRLALAQRVAVLQLAEAEKMKDPRSQAASPTRPGTASSRPRTAYTRPRTANNHPPAFHLDVGQRELKHLFLSSPVESPHMIKQKESYKDRLRTAVSEGREKSITVNYRSET